MIMLALLGWAFFAIWCATGWVGYNYAAALAFIAVFLVPSRSRGK